VLCVVDDHTDKYDILKIQPKEILITTMILLNELYNQRKYIEFLIQGSIT